MGDYENVFALIFFNLSTDGSNGVPIFYVSVIFFVPTLEKREILPSLIKNFMNSVIYVCRDIYVYL